MDETITNPDLAPKEIEKTQPAAGWMKLARAGWVICAAFAWGSLILSVAAQLSTLAAQENLVPQSETLLVANLIARTAAALISLTLAGVLYLKRPNERTVLLTAYFLLVNGMVITPLTFLEPYWPGAHSLSYEVIQPLFFAPLLVAFLSVFPNGRFTPAWTHWLVVAAILYTPVGTLLLTLPALSQPTAVFILAVLTWFALIFTGLFAQVHRFRRVSNATERQQTKWFLFGFSMEAVLALLIAVLTVGANYFSLDLSQRWWVPLINLGWALVFAALPVSLTFALMRYRLFDIDLIINRTLVYGALTASTMGLYIFVVGFIGNLLQLEDRTVIAFLATGLVAILFQPLRVRLQRGINRLFYGQRDDPLGTLSQLGKRLEVAIAPEAVLQTLVETISQTLKLPYVAISLRSGDEFRIAAESGAEVKDILRITLNYQGETVGELIVGPRAPGESFSKADKQLLANIAHQAGPAAYAVQLTEDLRQSRVRLVTTREEERRRLRRDLHDGLGPVLASQGLKMAAVAQLLLDDPARAWQLLEELAAQNEATVADIRRLVYELRPAALDDLGLVGAVRDYALALNGRAHNSPRLQVEVRAPDGGLPALPAAIEVAAYRIATEALTNVSRHARARHVSVWFEPVTTNGVAKLRLEILDDGVGLAADYRAGVGMISMRERAEEVGGSFLVESRSGRGARVAAVLPLAEAA